MHAQTDTHTHGGAGIAPRPVLKRGWVSQLHSCDRSGSDKLGGAEAGSRLATDTQRPRALLWPAAQEPTRALPRAPLGRREPAQSCREGRRGHGLCSQMHGGGPKICPSVCAASLPSRAGRYRASVPQKTARPWKITRSPGWGQGPPALTAGALTSHSTPAGLISGGSEPQPIGHGVHLCWAQSRDTVPRLRPVSAGRLNHLHFHRWGNRSSEKCLLPQQPLTTRIGQPTHDQTNSHCLAGNAEALLGCDPGDPQASPALSLGLSEVPAALELRLPSLLPYRNDHDRVRFSWLHFLQLANLYSSFRELTQTARVSALLPGPPASALGSVAHCTVTPGDCPSVASGLSGGGRRAVTSPWH